LPPDECIEIALWDRFPGWSAEQTDKLTQSKMRRVFVILEQQRATKDAVDSLGKPNEDKLKAKMAKRRAVMEAADDAANELGEEI
jgi:hypothetical protein